MQNVTSTPPAGDQPAPKPPKKPIPKWARIVLLIAGIIAMVSGLSQFFGGGHDVDYGKDDIHYYHDATRGDADALAKALQGAQFFGSVPDGATVLLDKQGDSITLSFVVKPEKAGDPDTQKFFHDLAVSVAKSISGNLVGIKLVDPDLNVKQTLSV